MILHLLTPSILTKLSVYIVIKGLDTIIDFCDPLLEKKYIAFVIFKIFTIYVGLFVIAVYFDHFYCKRINACMKHYYMIFSFFSLLFYMFSMAAYIVNSTGACEEMYKVKGSNLISSIFVILSLICLTMEVILILIFLKTWCYYKDDGDLHRDEFTNDINNMNGDIDCNDDISTPFTGISVYYDNHYTAYHR